LKKSSLIASLVSLFSNYLAEFVSSFFIEKGILKRSHKMKEFLKCLLFALIVSSLISCANLNSNIPPNLHTSEALDEPVGETSNEYLFELGDVIEIKFFYNPELNERVTIRPDGKISLQLIDEVEAVGLTPSELDKNLTEKYSEVLNNPEVAVIVKEFTRQKVFVGGGKAYMSSGNYPGRWI
jgi:protein involved in polysaccharide export with SLBB domain